MGSIIIPSGAPGAIRTTAPETTTVGRGGREKAHSPVTILFRFQVAGRRAARHRTLSPGHTRTGPFHLRRERAPKAQPGAHRAGEKELQDLRQDSFRALQPTGMANRAR